MSFELQLAKLVAGALLFLVIKYPESTPETFLAYFLGVWCLYG
jgi:hypothetical protein